jgi:hypothetical protein
MAFWLGQRLAISIAAGLVLAACNETDPAREDAARLVAQFCESATRCECASDLAKGSCEDNRTQLWDERIAEGRSRNLTYDLECFEAQVETAIEYGCWGAGKFEPHLCESFCAVFHGNHELGESCDGFDEVVSDCAQGLLCSDGKCVSPCGRLTGLGPGERCVTPEGQYIEECAEGLECSWDTQTCVVLVLPEIGQQCTGECAYGAYCDYNVYTCMPLLGEGANCLQAECGPELYCAYNYDGVNETAVCRRYAVEGESCAGPDVRCGSGLGCALDQICRAPGNEGEPCNGLGCQDDLFCDSEFDRCIAAPTEAGLPCPFGTCGAGLWCDNSLVPEGVCATVIADGERCSGHSQCESGYCPAAFCLPRPALGEDCTGTGLCQYGLVCDGAACVEAAEAGPAACSYRGW